MQIGGAVTEQFVVRLSELAALPRREVTADFHCVAGWSATDLHWEGVAFATFYRTIIEPLVPPDTPVTHVVFEGLDRYRSIVAIEDALADDVLIAEHVNGRPLEPDHGAPARLVSPNQYGFVSTSISAASKFTPPSPERPTLVSDRSGGFAAGEASSPGEGVARGAPSLPPGLGGAARLPARHRAHPVPQRRVVRRARAAQLHGVAPRRSRLIRLLAGLRCAVCADVRKERHGQYVLAHGGWCYQRVARILRSSGTTCMRRR